MGPGLQGWTPMGIQGLPFWGLAGLPSNRLDPTKVQAHEGQLQALELRTCGPTKVHPRSAAADPRSRPLGGKYTLERQRGVNIPPLFPR